MRATFPRPWRQASYGGAAEPLIMEAQRALG
jgi:hypothetical protein